MCVVIVTEKLSLNNSILFSFRRSDLHPWPEGVLVRADRAVPAPLELAGGRGTASRRRRRAATRSRDRRVQTIVEWIR